MSTRNRPAVALPVEDLKSINKVMWSSGDYVKVAQLLLPGARLLVDRLNPRPGAIHLDVATGNGNVALLAAARGTVSTGLDLTAEFFSDARRRAAERHLSVEFLEGDVEMLPFADAEFDIVTSTYGVQFTPRHDRAAAEIARVCRPGGWIGMCNWTPRSWTAHFHEVIGSYFPPSPSYSGQPMRWGDEAYLRRLLGTYFEFGTERATLWYPFDAEGLIAFFASHFGPLITARRSISPRRRWVELQAELVEVSEKFVVDGPDGRGIAVEYLLATGRRREPHVRHE